MPFLQLKYWRGIYDSLQRMGCEVHTARVGPVLSLKCRAKQLHSFLEDNFAGKSVNLVAHSMGGLDGRYVISHIPNRSYHILSLTTIATPHRGSSFMDWVRDTLGVGTIDHYAKRHTDDVVIASNKFDSNRRHFSHHKSPILHAIRSHLDAPAFTNLTRDYCLAFNELSKDDPSVLYASYAAVSHVSKLAPLHFSYQIIQSIEGANDGLVSLESAKWGEFKGILNCDHWDLVPPKVRGLATAINGKRFDPIQFYKHVAHDLAKDGF